MFLFEVFKCTNIDRLFLRLTADELHLPLSKRMLDAKELFRMALRF
jgi:hypothetical protein